MIKLKYFVFIITLLFIRCHYYSDKLVVKNNTGETICYETLTKTKQGIYSQNSGGGTIEPNNSSSPPVRNSIEASIQENNDSLYVVFNNCKDLEYVNSNLNTIIASKKYKFQKYSEKDLAEINWTVEYNGK